MNKLANSDENYELKVLKVKKLMSDEEKIKDKMKKDSAKVDKSKIGSGLSSQRPSTFNQARLSRSNTFK